MSLPKIQPAPDVPGGGLPVAAGALNAKHAEHFRTDHLLTNLRGRAISSGFVTIGAQAVKFGLYIVSIFILSRLLSKDDYGLVALVGTLSVLLRLLREAGLSTATVQQSAITHSQVSNLFWLNVLLGLGASVIGLALSPLMAWFYHDARLVGITIALSFTFLVSSASVQHMALLNRQMRFKATAAVEIGGLVMNILVGTLMALKGCRYWSLVGAQWATALTELVLAWTISRWRPQLPRRDGGTRSMVNFGASLTFATVFRRVANSSDMVLIGRFIGTEAAGVYSWGMALLMRPLDQFLFPMDTVFVPVLSRLQDQPERYRKTFLRVYHAIALVSFPIAGLFFGLSKPLVLMVLGRKWAEVVPVFAALSIAALYYPVAGASMWLLTTQRRNQDIVVLGMIISLVSIGSYAAGLPWGIAGVAFGFSLAGLFVRLPIQYYIVGRSGPVRTLDLWGVFLTQLPLWGVVAGASYAMLLLLPGFSPLRQLLVCAPVGIAAGAVTILALTRQRQMALELFGMMKGYLGAKKAPGEVAA